MGGACLSFPILTARRFGHHFDVGLKPCFTCVLRNSFSKGICSNCLHRNSPANGGIIFTSKGGTPCSFSGGLHHFR